MKVKHYTGVVVDVPDKKAARLADSGSWTYVTPPEKPAEPVSEAPKGDDTPQASQDVLDAPRLPEEEPEVKPAPTIPEIRAWGLENNIEGASPKGKLSKKVVDAYREAHKE